MKWLTALLMVSTVITSVYAERVRLRGNVRVYQRVGYRLEEKVTFQRDTVLQISNQMFRVDRLGPARRVRAVNLPRYNDSYYREDMASEINRNSDYADYFVADRDIMNNSVTIGGGSGPVYNPPVVVQPRPVPAPAPRYELIERCYERPKTYVRQTNRSQQQRGNRNIVGGILGAIGGQVIGDITGDDRLGDIISVVGLGFAAVGAVQVATATEVFEQSGGYDCTQYYTRINRPYHFSRYDQRTRRNVSCTTYRYESRDWGSSYEYFETTCNGSRYVTFERSREIWAY